MKGFTNPYTDSKLQITENPHLQKLEELRSRSFSDIALGIVWNMHELPWFAFEALQLFEHVLEMFSPKELDIINDYLKDKDLKEKDRPK
jgi:hypothetical protein